MAPRVAHGATRSGVSILLDAGHHAENRFSIGGLGGLRWPLKNIDSADLAAVAWQGRQNPPKVT